MRCGAPRKPGPSSATAAHASRCHARKVDSNKTGGGGVCVCVGVVVRVGRGGRGAGGAGSIEDLYKRRPVACRVTFTTSPPRLGALYHTPWPWARAVVLLGSQSSATAAMGPKRLVVVAMCVPACTSVLCGGVHVLVCSLARTRV